MEDDKIRELFSNFRPELSSDAIFLSRLKRNMHAVEFVKQQTAAMRRRSKIAVVVAAIVGFVSGVVMTLLTPLIANWLSAIKISLPDLGVSSLTFDGSILAWLLAATVCVILSLNAYELTLTTLRLNIHD